MEANLFNRHWSPESISHPTITRWIAKDRAAGGQLYRRLWSYGRKRWKGGKRHRVGRDCIPRRVDISERPEEVDRRCHIGDWEGDTVKGGAICFVTLPERFSRLFSARVKAAHTDPLDSGREFAEHRKRTEATGVAVYFARPNASSGNGEPTKTAMDACEGCGPKSWIYQHVQQETLRTASPTPGKVRKGLTSWGFYRKTYRTYYLNSAHPQ